MPQYRPVPWPTLKVPRSEYVKKHVLGSNVWCSDAAMGACRTRKWPLLK